jgi:hypothetical protein
LTRNCPAIYIYIDVARFLRDFDVRLAGGATPAQHPASGRGNSRMSARLAVAAVVLWIAVAWTPSAVFGGVSNVKQERTVSASIEFNEAIETHRSDKTGKFDQSAKAHYMSEIGDQDDVMTSQTSTLGSNSVSAHGTFDADSSGEVVAYRNTIDASFRVTAKTNYQLSFGSTIDFQLGPAPTDFISLELRKTGGPSPLVSQRFGGGDFDGGPVKLESSGPLAPGDYDLRFALHDEFAQFERIGHYDLQLSIDNGTTHAVPLPPAARTGLLTLSGLAGAMGYAGRRTRRNVGASLD